jgi:hypothetical protein
MRITGNHEIITGDKVALFRSYFSGLKEVYGTYDSKTGRAWQVKKPVTPSTIRAHLRGSAPYGVYLLTAERTRAIAVDFDEPDPGPAVAFVRAAKQHRVPAFIERSKSKGFHVWIFFPRKGVRAAKARLVVKAILEEIGHPNVEIFPKQDILDSRTSYGNYINAPLFGRFVPQGKTVFVDPGALNPYPDQWAFLASIERVDEQVLDGIINRCRLTPSTAPQSSSEDSDTGELSRFGLPPCARKMLREGVAAYQRVSCFRLAVHLKRVGLPYDIALAALRRWARKNRPVNGKRVIRENEIRSQVSYAFENSYTGYGCDSPAVAPFCEQSCPLK